MEMKDESVDTVDIMDKLMEVSFDFQSRKIAIQNLHNVFVFWWLIKCER